MLFPIENELRQVNVLNGIWWFKKESRPDQHVEERWFEAPFTDCIEMLHFLFGMALFAVYRFSKSTAAASPQSEPICVS